METRPRSKPKFKGSFFTWRTIISTNHEQGTQDVFLVFSSGKREAVLKYLWLKLVWAELTKDEFLLFVTTLKPSQVKEWAFLKALLRYPRGRIRSRLQELETLLGQKPSSQSSYLGYRRIRIDLQRWSRKLPKVKPYSGYVRNIASLGKNSLRLEISLEELVSNEVFTEINEFDWYRYLTVEEFQIPLLGVMVPLPEESQ